MTDKQFIKQLHAKARIAMKKGVAKALLEHERAGVPAVIWKNGKVVTVSISQSRKKKK